MLYGDAVWTRSPTPEAMAPLAGRDDEFVPLAELVDLAVEHGFAPVAVQEASLEEWDAFESGFTARYATWLAEHDRDAPGRGGGARSARSGSATPTSAATAASSGSRTSSCSLCERWLPSPA